MHINQIENIQIGRKVAIIVRLFLIFMFILISGLIMSNGFLFFDNENDINKLLLVFIITGLSIIEFRIYKVLRYAVK